MVLGFSLASRLAVMEYVEVLFAKCVKILRDPKSYSAYSLRTVISFLILKLQGWAGGRLTEQVSFLCFMLCSSPLA